MSETRGKKRLNRGESAVVGSVSPARFKPIRHVLFLMTCCIALGSCDGNSANPDRYDDVRIVTKSSHPIHPGASSDQRFGSNRPVRPADERQDGPQLAYTLPDGWIEVPLTTMRRINVLVAGDSATECYLTVLPGGGSLRANLDRWCQQMQQPPISDEALEELTRTTLLGAEAVRFEIDGTFSGGIQGKPVKDARMIAYVLPVGDTTVFLKATGPRTVLQPESEALDQFATSIHLKNRNAPPASTSSLRWEVPSGWQVDSPRPMREVTFITGPEARCWITLLGGDGGGPLANTNRWLSEMGQDPISTTQLAELPTTECLGGEATIIESTGSYASMGSTAQDGWALIGLIRTLPDQTVFIKMVGPEAEVEAARDSLTELISSLEVTR